MNTNSKRLSRLRRAKKTRILISNAEKYRLTVHKTPMHIYAQVFSLDGRCVLASASTLEKELTRDLKHTGNKDAASLVGAAVAQRAMAAGITCVAFDRSGFKFHGRIKALADAARENGLLI